MMASYHDSPNQLQAMQASQYSALQAAAAQFNAGAANQMSLANAAMQSQAGQFGAAARNQAAPQQAVAGQYIQPRLVPYQEDNLVLLLLE